jgi:hypothetical protein
MDLFSSSWHQVKSHGQFTKWLNSNTIDLIPWVKYFESNFKTQDQIPVQYSSPISPSEFGGSCHQQNSKFQIPEVTIKFQLPDHGAMNLEPALLVFGFWDFGILTLVFGIWYLVFGIWNLVSLSYSLM